ncbi:helix-turn-helix transcriptional regulator [Streptomyces sp. NPDC020766]|uniref:helix-turn-helix domain-containing protein n=1 Tax=Streptomyces sp. NPDC020766 TaxID=3155011 RepID=UPI003408F68E
MWRQEAGVSREDVGKESNYSPDTITSFERGVRMPGSTVRWCCWKALTTSATPTRRGR